LHARSLRVTCAARGPAAARQCRHTCTGDSMELAEVNAALKSWVDGERLPGVSYAVLRGPEVIATQCIGWADREARVPLRQDHLFRIFSNTKLVTSVAALQLIEQGRIAADDPVSKYIPALADL